jgi:L-rhamnose mutarotase
MKRYGMVIGVRAEKLDEYKALHAAVWPAVLEMIRQWHYLFSYFEYSGSDFAADMARMAADPTTQRWWALCQPCQGPLADRSPGEWWANMEEVFHMD